MLENFSFQSIKDMINRNKNAKIAVYVVSGLLVLVIGFFGYRQFVWKPKNEKSKDAFWPGLNLAAKDSTDQAIEALAPVVKKYDGTLGGENAQFTIARQYMAKGEFKKALKELDGVELSDTYLAAMKVGLQGDCHSEMKDFEKAGTLYLQAAEVNANDFTSPMYFFKAGLCAEKVKDFQKATECYTRIKDEYPNFASQKSIEKYVARASNKTTKK